MMPLVRWCCWCNAAHALVADLTVVRARWLRLLTSITVLHLVLLYRRLQLRRIELSQQMLMHSAQAAHHDTPCTTTQRGMRHRAFRTEEVYPGGVVIPK